MTYSIKEQQDNEKGVLEYVVTDNSGILVPPPHTFSSKTAALGRIAELERKDAIELAERLKAKPPTPGMRCYGKIVGASDTLLIQHLGRDQYVQHRRADSEAFAEIEVGDQVRIVNGKVEYPERSRSSSPSI